jgi:hypothetical protein
MDKIEALNLFVKNNISFLSSNKATHSIVKKMRQDFYIKHHLKSNSYFKIKDIIESLIREISKVKANDSLETILKDLKTIPFIIEELSEDRIYNLIIQYRSEGKSILTKEELSNLRQEPYRIKIEEKFKKKAKDEIEKELSEERKKLEYLLSEVEKEKDYLSKYKSELDDYPTIIEFEEKDLEIEQTSSEIEKWWQRIDLIGNPFPSDEGLLGIPKELYENVVVRTRFVESYLAKVENCPQDFLGQSVAVIGEFGSGKTTLLNMISYKLGSKGILPCKIMLIPSPDADSIIKEFLRQLGGQLEIIITESSGTNKRGIYGTIDSLSQLGLILDEFKYYGGEGLVVSIDGLHKESDYLKQTIDFLKQLQNIHEYIQDHKEVKCGFLIAGSLFWEKEIAGLKSIKGSISKFDVIPSLSETEAVEAIVRRINAFSKEGSQPTIRKDSIRLAYQNLIQESKESITFRNFLNYIKDRLEIEKYEEVGIGISSQYELVGTIKKIMRESDIASEYNEIERNIQEYPNLRKIISDILPKIYSLQGIIESKDLFKKYTKIFNLLRVNNFIVKRKSPRRGEDFVWAISPNVTMILKKINREYSIKPEDILDAMFKSEKEIISKETNTVYTNLLSRISDYIIKLKDSWPEFSLKLEEIKSIITTLEEQIINEELKNFNADLLPESCRLLLYCVLKAGGVSIHDVHNCSDSLNNFWYMPENVNEIMQLCKDKNKKYEKYPEIFALMAYHSRIMEQLLDLLRDLTRGEAISRLINRNLVSQDMKKIHDARILFLDNSYRETVDIICELLEEKAREIGFIIIKSIWAEDWKIVMPEDLKNINLESRGHPRTRRSPDANFFYDISRSEYSKIIFQKKLRKIIWGRDMSDNDFLEMKNIWELAFSLGDREAHRDRPTYFTFHATEIADVLRYIPKICERFLIAVESLLTEINFNYEKFGKQIKGKYFIEGLTSYKNPEIIIDEKEAKRIINTFLTSFDRYPREIIPLQQILIVEGASTESQIAILNGLIQKRNVLLIKNKLEITDKGKNELKQLSN